MKVAVKYSGVAPDTGRMSALELGPAIIGLSEMIGETGRILYGDSSHVRLDVRADFEHASFGIEFIAVASAHGLLPALSLEQLAEITAILGISGKGIAKGVLGMLRWQRGRKIDAVERSTDGVIIIIQSESRQVTTQIYNTFINPTVRGGFDALTKPLESGGVDAVTIAAGDAPPESIPREERPAFAKPPLPEEEIGVDTATAVLEIAMPDLRGDRKWLFAQGEQTFFAEIADEKFLERVATRRDVFGRGDALRVVMEVRSRRTGIGFAFDRKITQVLAHIPNEPGGAQISLL